MKIETALLDVRRMDESDRLTVAAGTPAIQLMENAGWAVSREIDRRWPAPDGLFLEGRAFHPDVGPAGHREREARLKKDTPDAAKEGPAGYRASPRPYQPL